MKSRLTILVFLAGFLPLTSGCWLFRGPGVEPRLPPATFSGQPTLNDLLFAINDNTSRISQLQTDNADIRVRGFKLKASLALQPSNDFRLRAGLTALTGSEVDIGSNQQLMWMWTKWHPQPAVYYVYHDDFARGAAREMIPVDPRFLIEALGLVRLDPNLQHEGPFDSGENRLQIISRIPTPQGEITRLTVVDDRYGWVLEQHLRDANGNLLASAEASKHQYYEFPGVSLPHQVRVVMAPGTPAQFEFRLEVRRYFINQLVGDATRLFQLPAIDGYTQVNLGGAGALPYPAIQTLPGQTRQGQTLTGQTLPGQTLQGQTLQGQTLQGQTRGPNLQGNRDWRPAGSNADRSRLGGAAPHALSTAPQDAAPGYIDSRLGARPRYRGDSLRTR